MKLFGGTKSKITKDENVPHLEITEVGIIYYNIVATINSEIQESYIHLSLINHLVNL